MDRDIRHLSEEALQGFLDGSLPEGEAGRVQEHVASCVRCRSELEAWEVLFHELGELGDLAPTPGFADRVMASLPREEPVALPLTARVKKWFGRRERVPVFGDAGHLTPGTAQDLLEGLLPREVSLDVEDHLHGCRLCRDEVDGWRTLMLRLDEVPQLAPSPDFTERVMAHVRVQNALAVARPTLQERVASWLGGVSPRTRKRIAGLAGAAVTPLATLALVTWVVFSHPLVTVGNLVSFLWLETQDAVGALATALVGETVDSGLLVQAAELVRAIGAAPGAAALAFATFSILTLVAVWVLYRNLIATHVDGRYAHASS